jgi:hypothetical protein
VGDTFIATRTADEGSGTVSTTDIIATAMTVRALSGRLSGLSVSHSKSVSCGAFVRVRRAPNS